MTSLAARLDQLHAELTGHAAYDLGFPGATDLPDMTAVARFDRLLLNNVGHPYAAGGAYRLHTKPVEHEVVQFVADLAGAPPSNRHGYVTTGSTESTLWALWQARRHLSGGAVFASTAAHYSVAKNAELLGLPLHLIPTDARGEIRYDALAAHASLRPGAIVVATVGTTMTEAVDSVRRINEALAGVDPSRRWIHADAALAGIPLALCDPPNRPFADGAHSFAVSGHKFLATPFPCGVVVALADRQTDRGRIPYTATPDSTITGSRSGHAPLWLWFLLRHWGRPGLHARATAARDLAAYTERRLRAIGWPAWRAHEHAFTVVFPRPPEHLLTRWPLATDEHGNAHVVCMPGKSRALVDRFVTDLADTLTGAAR